MSYEKFMDSCPKELEPFVEAERLKILRRDEDMWVMGMYVQNAVAVAVEHCLAGRKAKSQYMKSPLREQAEEEKEEKLSEEKLQQMREAFVAKLMTMKTNFELENEKNDRV